jgi:hypothetical protein
VSATDARFRVPETVLRARLEDADVLLNTATGRYHLLSGLGPRILADLEAGRTVDAVVAEVSGDHAAAADRVRTDVDGFVTALLDKGLLERRP